MKHRIVGPALLLLSCTAVEVCAADRFTRRHTAIDDVTPVILGAICPAQSSATVRARNTPTSALPSLQKLSENGVWILKVSDAYNHDAGLFSDWSFAVNCGAEMFAPGCE